MSTESKTTKTYDLNLQTVERLARNVKSQTDYEMYNSWDDISPILMSIKQKNKFNVLLDDRINISAPISLATYIAKVYTIKRSHFVFKDLYINTIIDHARGVLKEYGNDCKFTFQELVIIQIKQMISIHCVVLQKNDVAPDSKSTKRKSSIVIDPPYCKGDEFSFR